ncbi:hypothetical protein C8R45DRAFT_1221041 [Mycena sanguinolenta]|nr:hypothetical protein C8R45DRAFT_1221041 [Mycena sanguinolenta]
MVCGYNYDLAANYLDSGAHVNTENDSVPRTTIVGGQAPRSPATHRGAARRQSGAMLGVHSTVQVIECQADVSVLGWVLNDERGSVPRLPPMPLPALDAVTGSLLIATWARYLLYMFEITQGFYYFQNFEEDNWKQKTLVTLALLVDTLSIVNGYISVYLYTITHAGNLEYLYSFHWPTPIYGFTTGVLAILVQAFLVFRYWRFTQHTLISLVLSVTIIVSFCSVFICNLMLTLHTSLLADRAKLKILVAFWLVTEVAVDAGIALVLLWEFRKARGTLKETQSVLDRLTGVTIQSGAAAATIAGAALIAYFINPESNVPGAIFFLLGRVYVITLLSNLNIRKSAKSVSTTETSSVPVTTGDKRGPLTLTRWTTDDPCDIPSESGMTDVHRTVHTSVQVLSV